MNDTTRNALCLGLSEIFPDLLRKKKQRKAKPPEIKAKTIARGRSKYTGFVYKSIIPPASKHKAAKSRRLARIAANGGTFSKEEWNSLLAQYDGKCLRCGTTKEQIVPDHVKPLYRGGSNGIENIQPLCLMCNMWKGIREIDYREEA
jgi:5-methylcytosine-specific restriction endonuclease McrA